MSVIRMPEGVWETVRSHLFSGRGERFAFLTASWTYSSATPVFTVTGAITIPDEAVEFTKTGWQMSTGAIAEVINEAVRSGGALIEAHNHGGRSPRFSRTDREGFGEFVPYVLSSLPGRPYAATVWGDSTVYGEFFTPKAEAGCVRSITVVGQRIQQIVSADDDGNPSEHRFDRQLPWFTEEGQRQLGRLRVGVVGCGGTGSQMAQNLVYLGIRDFALIDEDGSDETSLNRLVTAAAADVDTPKVILARRLIRSVAPGATVIAVDRAVQSREALDALKGVDVLFGCVDNDGARLILNEIALAYRIPYFDLAVGIDAEGGSVSGAGGRVAVVLPGGPCLNCMGEIDPDEARFCLSTPEQQAEQIARGYVRGMDVRAPAVAPLNAAVAAAATTELAILVSGLRAVHPFLELDLLGVGRKIRSQWMTPREVARREGCVQCAVADQGDAARIERYASEE